MDRRSLIIIGAIGAVNPFLRSVAYTQPEPKTLSLYMGCLLMAHAGRK
jgi:hypothetical protein